MDIFIISVLLIIFMWLLNFFLGMFQIRNFNREYIKLRTEGKVAIGRKKGYFAPGAIVLLLVKEDGQIVSGKKMYGSSVLARLKNFNDFDTQNILAINEDTVFKYPKSMRKALLDARDNFNNYQNQVCNNNCETD